MKKSILLYVVACVVSIVTPKVFADPGMPKAFDLIASVGGPLLSGKISEIHLNQFRIQKDQVCGEYTNFEYAGSELKLTIAGEEYVLDKTTGMALSFASKSCDLNSSNVVYMMLKFDHQSMNLSVGVEIDLSHNIIRIGSRDISGGVGRITSKY